MVGWLLCGDEASRSQGVTAEVQARVKWKIEYVKGV
jgi:hypothetical protein